MHVKFDTYLTKSTLYSNDYFISVFNRQNTRPGIQRHDALNSPDPLCNKKISYLSRSTQENSCKYRYIVIQGRVSLSDRSQKAVPNQGLVMENSKVFIGNLDFAVTDEEIRILFSDYGTVVNIKLHRKKGYAFVEMSNEGEAALAIEKLNNSPFKDREIRVSLELKTKKAKALSIKKYNERSESFSRQRKSRNPDHGKPEETGHYSMKDDYKKDGQNTPRHRTNRPAARRPDGSPHPHRKEWQHDKPERPGRPPRDGNKSGQGRTPKTEINYNSWDRFPARSPYRQESRNGEGPVLRIPSGKNGPMTNRHIHRGLRGTVKNLDAAVRLILMLITIPGNGIRGRRTGRHATSHAESPVPRIHSVKNGPMTNRHIHRGLLVRHGSRAAGHGTIPGRGMRAARRTGFPLPTARSRATAGKAADRTPRDPNHAGAPGTGSGTTGARKTDGNG